MSTTRTGSGAFVFVFIAVLVDSIGFGIILPVLPSLIMALAHVNVAQAAEFGGWLAFVYALMQFFCAPVLGNLSDRFGRRPVLLFALLALGIDYLIMGSAPVISWLFVGRMVAGMAGASFTPAYAYIADITPPEKRAQSFGLMGAAFGMQIGRQRNKKGILWAVLLTSLYLSAFIGAKSMKHFPKAAWALYFLPFVVIALFSIRSLKRISRGIE